jgi:L-threonylcarbamoyladenylate synthase
MKTLLLKINQKKPDPKKIKQAALILKKGGLVAFPTDTVYGLAADARNSRAVKKIFKIKKRPLSNPLPILIGKKSDLKKYALGISPKIKKIAAKFWPGPLTIVLRKKKIISDVVTAGKDSVGIRLPANSLAVALVRALGRPITATSANISAKPSPVTFDAVQKHLNKKIDLILDGEKTDIGVESTVLDCTTLPPTILRSGAIPLKNLKEFLKK